MQELYMHQLYIDQSKLFMIQKDVIDNGYAVHACLNEVFREHAPSPFAIVGSNGKRLDVLAYSNYSIEQLKEDAKTDSLPYAYECIDWDAMRSKKMPLLPKESVFDFKIRMCPVRRQKKKELDVYLSEVFSKRSSSLDRLETYSNWFAELLTAKCGAESAELKVEAFRLASLERRDSDRVIKRLRRPDVTFSGTLMIRDEEQFYRSLSKGFGRHKAFGFGMILLKRRQRF